MCSPWFLFGATFAARAAYSYYNFDPAVSKPDFGGEVGAIASSIASGQGFASPFTFHASAWGGPSELFLQPTGPTAWVPPVYPYIIAGLFRLFGAYSAGAFLAAQMLNCCFAALTGVLIMLLGARMFGRAVGCSAGWAWTLIPFALLPWRSEVTWDIPFNLHWMTETIWDNTLSGLLLTLLLWLTLIVADHPNTRAWGGYGVVWGLSALTNTTMLAMLPAALGWAVLRQRRERGKLLWPVASCLLACGLVLSVWTWRNYREFGHVFPVRSNLGNELRIGNALVSNGLFLRELHPAANPHEMGKYREAGEIAYNADRRREAVALIANQPGRFALLCVERFIYFWTGPPVSSERLGWLAGLKNIPYVLSSTLAFIGVALAFRNQRRGAALLLAVLLLYPAVYYITFYNSRYRQPMEPFIVLLMVYALSEVMSLPRLDRTASSE